MTVENCLRLLKEYEAAGRTAAYEDMKKHIETGRKFQQLKVKEEPKEEVKEEVKKDGKKSKG